MKRVTEQPAPHFKLMDINATEFNSHTLKGKGYLLTFYRFASCPFCNLRLHNIVQNTKNYADDFIVVAVFDSTLQNLQQFTTRHQAPFLF